MSAQPALSHVGIFVRDLAAMTAFYRDCLGMAVTDQGSAQGAEVVFMSSDPAHHHQLVLASGRGPEQPSTLCQLSFLLKDLPDLREALRTLKEHDAEPFRLANHGTSWSAYVLDPEDNPVELYVNTRWYISQPRAEVLDLRLSDAEIWAATEAMCADDPTYLPIEQWRSKLADRRRADV